MTIHITRRGKHTLSMIRKVLSRAYLLLLAIPTTCLAQLPKTIQTPFFNTGHCQGIAVDVENKAVYYSFTTFLVKTDFTGKVLGTVSGVQGHLGCLDWDAQKKLVYASLEYNDDEIGRGVKRQEHSNVKLDNTFYVAIFDARKITRIGMDAARDSVMRICYLGKVSKDYTANVKINGATLRHRLGCAGFDGISLGPDFGVRDDTQYLTIAYGIYNDTTRTDNDYQVLQQYQVERILKKARPFTTNDHFKKGIRKPRRTYYAYTGNTTYGVQNLEYDPATGLWFMAVYRGHKRWFPNHKLYVVDGTKPTARERLKGVPYIKCLQRTLPLLKSAEQSGDGQESQALDASYGLHALGDGYFYVVESIKDEAGRHGAILHLATWDADRGTFSLVK